MATGDWPGSAWAKLSEDLTGPTRELLESMNLLEKDSELGQTRPGAKRAIQNTTPESIQVLTAGATSLSKVATWIVTSLGGVSAITVGLTTWATKDDSNSPLMLVLVGSVAVVMAAAAVAIAVIVKADVTARATASAAAYRARAQTAQALLAGFAASRPFAEPRPRYVTRRKSDQQLLAVKEFIRDGDEIKLRVNGGTMLSRVDIDALVPFTDWQRERAGDAHY